MWTSLGLVCILLIASCTPMDHYYKDLILLGDRQYAGKPVDVEARAGRDRTQIVWSNPSDPAVSHAIVFWNNYRDSVLVTLDRTTPKDSVVIDLAEGQYVVNVVTQDEAGNRSLPVEITASSYGDLYQETLRNRVVSNVELLTDSVNVIWNEEFQETMISTELSYIDLDGQTRHVQFAKDSQLVGLAAIDLSKPVSVQGIFLPEPSAIDTFRSEVELLDLSQYQLRELSLVASSTSTAEFINFASVIVQLQADAQANSHNIDLAHLRGATTGHNFIVITDGAGFGAFQAALRTTIESWPTRNHGELVNLGNDPAHLAMYNALDEGDRAGMIDAFNQAAAAKGTTGRLTLIAAGDIILFHSVDRGLYVAIHVLDAPNGGNMNIVFKVSKP